LVAVACFLPGRAKDLSAPPRKWNVMMSEDIFSVLQSGVA